MILFNLGNPKSAHQFETYQTKIKTFQPQNISHLLLVQDKKPEQNHSNYKSRTAPKIAKQSSIPDHSSSTAPKTPKFTTFLPKDAAFQSTHRTAQITTNHSQSPPTKSPQISHLLDKRQQDSHSIPATANKSKPTSTKPPNSNQISTLKKPTRNSQPSRQKTAPFLQIPPQLTKRTKI